MSIIRVQTTIRDLTQSRELVEGKKGGGKKNGEKVTYIRADQRNYRAERAVVTLEVPRGGSVFLFLSTFPFCLNKHES